jgi:hypothetical protein
MNGGAPDAHVQRPPDVADQPISAGGCGRIAEGYSNKPLRR